MKDKRELRQDELVIFNDALYYMKMAELKKACMLLTLPDKGKKMDLIERIMAFITTGKIIESAIIPQQSRAKNYPHQPLQANSLMLYGGYKNDAQARAFFKHLIGEHFHFTAFGIDWLNERWLQGNPPTYQEFANYWVEETALRKQIGSKAKDEWKFINFMQEMNREQSDLSQRELMERWKLLQAEKARFVFMMIELMRFA
jgi:hypothetical protein